MIRFILVLTIAAGTLGYVSTREAMQTHDALTYADGYLRGEWTHDKH